MLKCRVASLPYLVWAAIFILLPMAMVCWYALTDADGTFTPENITAIGQHTPVLIRSMGLALVATAICILLAFPFSFVLSRIRGVSQTTLMMLLMLPMWMNFLLRTYSWMSLLENNGIINRILMAIGLEPLALINTPGAVVLGMVYNYLPFAVLPMHSVMVKIDNSLIEAAQDLGASRLRVFSRLVLPLSVPGITTAITTVFVPAVSTFTISQMLGGSSNILIGDLIQTQFLGNAYNPHLGSAMSLVLMAVVLVCMSIANQFDDEEMGGMLL